MKTTKTKKQVLRERLLAFLSDNPHGVLVRDIHKIGAPDVPISSVYNMLWLLRKDGQVSRDGDTRMYYPMPAQVGDEPPKVPNVGVRMVEDELGMKPYDWTRDTQYGRLRDRYDNLLVEHSEALVVIKWLETKVENLIRAQVV
jgi:hypothetical protein